MSEPTYTKEQYLMQARTSSAWAKIEQAESQRHAEKASAHLQEMHRWIDRANEIEAKEGK